MDDLIQVKKCLKNGDVDINKTNYSDNTPITIACNFDRFEFDMTETRIKIIKEILNYPKFNINQLINNQSTVLMRACMLGHLNIVELLLNDPRININIANNCGYTAFIYACSCGYLNIVKRLLKEKSININARIMFQNYTGIMIAYQQQHLNIVSLLLKHPKIEINMKNDIKWFKHRHRIILTNYIIPKKYLRILSFYERLITIPFFFNKKNDNIQKYFIKNNICDQNLIKEVLKFI
jgi:ankyrin repeat protein